MIGVVDYGVANIGAMMNMLKKIGELATIVRSESELAAIDKLILPGVGAFDHGVKALQERGLFEPIRRVARTGTLPVLGVCLGMQLLGESSEEGEREGLGLIAGRTVRLQSSPEGSIRIPNIGWSRLRISGECNLFRGLEAAARFYFVHSYQLRPADEDNVVAVMDGADSINAAVHRGNVYGVQFHPEKSHRFGMQLLRNFAAL